MPSTVKCPRCSSDVDVTSFAPGSSVRCSDCGGLMRVPTGRTGVNPAVKAPVAGGSTSTRTKVAAVGGSGGTKLRTKPATAVDRETSTRVRQAAAGRSTQMRPRKSKTGLYVLLGFAALALIVVGAVLFLGTPANTPSAQNPSPIAKPPAAPKPPTPAPAPAPAPAVEDPPPAPPPAPRGDEAARTNWEDVLRQLRGGGGFDVEGRPEQVYFQRVQKMGKSAYPYLVRYINNEDPALGRAAVAVLNALTSQNKPLPNEATKAKLKTEWEAWVKANP